MCCGDVAGEDGCENQGRVADVHNDCGNLLRGERTHLPALLQKDSDGNQNANDAHLLQNYGQTHRKLQTHKFGARRRRGNFRKAGRHTADSIIQSLRKNKMKTRREEDCTSAADSV